MDVDVTEQIAEPAAPSTRLGPGAFTVRPEPALFTIRANERHSTLSMLIEVIQYREVMRSFASRFIRVKYKQASLGLLWAVLQPLVFVGIFTLFFGRVARLGAGSGVPYVAFSLTAVIPWQFVSNATTQASSGLLQEGGTLKKVYFPKETAVLGVVMATLVDLAVGIGLLLGISPFVGAHLGINLLFLPVLIVATILPVIAVSMPLAALYVYYRDIRFVLPLGVQMWMYISPVVFPLTKVPERWRLLYAFFDPVVGPLYGYFRVVAVGAPPDWTLLGASGLTGCVLLWAGHALFRRMQPRFADVI